MSSVSKICAIVCVLGLSICGCGGATREVVARAASPLDGVEAILFEVDGGTTTTFSYEVELVDKNTGHASLVAVLVRAGRNQEAYGANLRWVDGSTLWIEYLSARTESLKRPTLTIGGRTIQVVLKSGINDPSAPRGGMFYNLQRSKAEPPK
jgi:hypothetical protein